jgi:hypothetical protein
VEAASKRVDAALEKVGALNQELHVLELNERPKLRAQFEALIAEEKEPDGKISGQAYQHLGIIVPARPPL